MDGLTGSDTVWAMGLIFVGALAAASLLKSLFFSGRKFVQQEMEPLDRRVGCVESDINGHDERLRTVETDLSGIKATLEGVDNKLECVDKKLDNLNNAGGKP